MKRVRKEIHSINETIIWKDFIIALYTLKNLEFQENCKEE